MLSLATTPTLAQQAAETPYAMPPETWMPAPEIPSPWLDEVRAQRHAWEARRKAAREEYTARRRLNNPRGSAHQEIWEEDLRRRRAERQERIDQQREHFLSLPPGQPAADRPDDGGATSADPQSTEYPGASDPMFTPPGWNNLWYFRGF
ncbi:hypothetical protein CKO23_01455 [Thiocystis violacea]|nr:hypothetical protein [Thiocystis violacea]